MEPLIVNVALDTPEGAEGARDAALSRLVAEAARCRDAGAAIVQVSLGRGGRASADEALAAIRESSPDLLLSLATCGAPGIGPAERDEPASIPDLATLPLGTINLPGLEAMHAPDAIRAEALALQRAGVSPELELFDWSMAEFIPYLRRRGLLRAPLYAQLVLGIPGLVSATADNLCALVRALPPETIWSATGVAERQFQIHSLAVVMGGHVRIGGDPRGPSYGPQVVDRATDIERIVRLAHAAGRAIATPEQARQRLGIVAPRLALARAA